MGLMPTSGLRGAAGWQQPKGPERDGTGAHWPGGFRVCQPLCVSMSLPLPLSRSRSRGHHEQSCSGDTLRLGTHCEAHGYRGNERSFWTGPQAGQGQGGGGQGRCCHPHQPGRGPSTRGWPWAEPGRPGQVASASSLQLLPLPNADLGGAAVSQPGPGKCAYWAVSVEEGSPELLRNPLTRFLWACISALVSPELGEPL